MIFLAFPPDGHGVTSTRRNVAVVGNSAVGQPSPIGRRFAGAFALLAFTAAACGSDDPPNGRLGATDAMTAIVQWQAIEQEPVLDDEGEALLPVIYVVAADGGTIDVGVQAAVAQAVADTAVVRFADDAADAFDLDAEGEPVRDDGALLAVGAVPDPSSVLMVDVDRYTEHEEPETLTVRVAARTDFASLPADLDPELNRGEVTDVLPR